MTEREIYIHDWVIDAQLGIYAHEKNRTQKLEINLVFYADDKPVVTLNDTIDYDALKKEITALIKSRHFELLETLADEIAALALKHPLMKRVMVQLEKTEIYDDCDGCGVRLTRSR